ELAELREPSHVGDGHPRVVDEVLLDELANVPAVAELLADRDGDPHALPERTVDARILRAHEVLREEGVELLDERAQAHGIGGVEPRGGGGRPPPPRGRRPPGPAAARRRLPPAGPALPGPRAVRGGAWSETGGGPARCRLAPARGGCPGRGMPWSSTPRARG